MEPEWEVAAVADVFTCGDGAFSLGLVYSPVYPVGRDVPHLEQVSLSGGLTLLHFLQTTGPLGLIFESVMPGPLFL